MQGFRHLDGALLSHTMLCTRAHLHTHPDSVPAYALRVLLAFQPCSMRLCASSRENAETPEIAIFKLNIQLQSNFMRV